MLSYTSRDFNSTFKDIKDIITKIEPRAEVETDKANVESILTKIIAGCVDVLSYNQDANILEAFPSTARTPRAIFDLLSLVGYTPKTCRTCHVMMTLWDPSYVKAVRYEPFTEITFDGYKFYNPDMFECASGIVTPTQWYEGEVVTPTKRETAVTKDVDEFIKNYYPNLSTSVISNNEYDLPEAHTDIDSRTIRIYTDDGEALTYVENPYMTNITPSSFSIYPAINSNGYILRFSPDVATGALTENLYYFYVRTSGVNVGSGLTPDFSGLSIDNSNDTSFSYSYSVEQYKAAETAADARENIAYEFGWWDTPKAIVTKPDCERAILQQDDAVAAVDVRDANDFSKADSSKLEYHAFIKLKEDAELSLDVGSAMGHKNVLQTHLNKFKMLPLTVNLHIDNVPTEENEIVTHIYGWYPDVTIYLKEQVDAQEAGAILTQVNDALFERFKYINCNFNEVPRIVDIIDTIQNAVDIILYLDIDGVYYRDMITGELVDKETVTGKFTTPLAVKETSDDQNYKITLNTLNKDRKIQSHTVKIVDSNNDEICYDNGDGTLISATGYLKEYGTVNYTTGEVKFTLSQQPPGDTMYVYHKLEDPTWCKYINVGTKSIKIALESLKA